MINNLTDNLYLALINIVPVKKLRQKIRNNFRIKIFGRELAKTAIEKKVIFKMMADKFNTVAMGSSHCQADFNPAYFEAPSFNFGLSSMDNSMEYKVYQNIIKGTNVKNIIVFYSVFSAGNNNTKRRDFNDAFLPLKYVFGMDYSGDNKAQKRFCEQYEKSISKTIDFDNCGYPPKIDPIDISELDSRCASHLKIWKKGGEDEWIYKLAEECKEDGKNFILVISPAQKVYKDKLPDSETIFGEFKSKLFNINSSAVVYNLYDTDSFENPELWLDMDHMNEKGAQVFTEYLCNLLKHDKII